MTGSDAGSIIPMEIFIEPDEVTPMRVFLKFLNPTKDRSTPRLITQKDTGQTARKLPRHLFKGQHIAWAGGKLHFEWLTVKMVEGL